jgi:uncharacterized protein (TIGR02421 family)
MPGWGRLHVDRQLPFLVVYRRPADRPDPGTDRLVTGVASYLVVDGDPTRRDEVVELVRTVAEVMRGVFGAFLIIEVWAGNADGDSEAALAIDNESLVRAVRPAYRLCTRRGSNSATTVAEIERALEESRIMRQRPVVSSGSCRSVAPPGMRQLFTGRELQSMQTDLIGVEVRPVYREGAEAEGELYPVLLRQMGRRLATACDRGAYRFTRDRTTARPVHYHALGRRAFVKAVWEVDAALARIGESFDPLLQVTPTNAEQSWAEFRRSRFQRRPRFHYRPLPFEPGRMKHRLWSVRPERVEDPTLMYLFRDAQVSIDRQLSLLSEIERPEFLHTSLQLHGGVEPGLLSIARQLLETRSGRPRKAEKNLPAPEFADLAAEEVHAYRSDHPAFGVLPVVRDDIYSGLLVSRGNLYIGAQITVPVSRADALIQHEVGTHMVTYHNGREQPLRLLATGLPGYGELQEGLAVLGEYLAGGLDLERLRTLAARVVAVDAMSHGAEFVDAWRLLGEYGFTQRAAFTITTRVYRGGGLAKDAMYLRGLAAILDYLAEDCEFERLFLGKFALKHLPVVDELLLRKVLAPPAVLPRYLQRPDAIARLDLLRQGQSVIELVKGTVRPA